MATVGVSLYPYGLSYRAAVTLGKLAEDYGFDSVFVVEGGVNNDAMAMAEAVALGTQRITVGTGIANLYFRHPATLGAGAVAIDELSDGRFILGIGASNPGMIGSLGLTWRDPRVALRETTEWLRQVFAGKTPPGIRTPFRPAQHSIPIHWAGVALETAELAGELADGLMAYIAPKERFTQLVARMQRGAQRAGRQPQAITVSLLIPTFLAEDLDAARAAARRFLAFYAAMPLYATMFRRSGFQEDMEKAERAARSDAQASVAAISDRLADAVCLIGPPSRCQERLAAWREAGLAYPILAPQAVQEEPPTAVRRLIEAFARQ
jgi:alkanesulfonate monooxygenase SsuD/methylene tetrahydromethanopterin reductase-like flavin-dependent oxidoreductase (luciferase family)